LAGFVKWDWQRGIEGRSYFYDVDGIRSNPKTSRVRNGAVVSATGVNGVR
jgi:hypothetical protein